EEGAGEESARSVRWFGKRREERAALPPFAITVGPAGGMLPTWAGTTVGTDEAMRLAAVWSCIRLLADTVSTLPVDCYRQGGREPLTTTPTILLEPAAGTPISEFVYSVMVSLLLRGNCYGIITARQGSTLLPAQVELVHPDRVGVQVQPDGSVVYRLLGTEIDTL